jgi:hypothetical protein
MGGRIWVESSGVPGEGSTFAFTIATRTSREPLRHRQRADAERLEGKRVLIVDDNAPTGACSCCRRAPGTWLSARSRPAPRRSHCSTTGERFDLALVDW